MKTFVCVLGLLLCAPRVAAPQNSTAEGIEALARGDDATAARILSERIERAGDPDPVAQFFLATLYQFGRGVPSDTIRACALYLNAAVSAAPLRPLSVSMAEAIHRGSPQLRQLCEDGRATTGTPSATTPALDPDPAARARQAGPTTRIAGVEAFVASEYGRAAEVLRPIAEHWPSDLDDVASLLVAAMYETGLGLPADPVRACALTLCSSVEFPIDRRATGFASMLATELFGRFRALLTPQQFGMCHLLAKIGFDHGFEKHTLSLDADHWVAFELSAETQEFRARVNHRGKEKATDIPLTLDPGIRFLPVVHTELAAGAASRARHFIGIFTWVPLHPGEWALVWSLKEVVALDLVSVVSAEFVTTIRAEQPTAEDSDAARSMTRVRLNDAGDVEWRIVDNDPTPRGSVIETEVDRAAEPERQARADARRKADEQVNWSVERDPHRAPGLAYVDAASRAMVRSRSWMIGSS